MFAPVPGKLTGWFVALGALEDLFPRHAGLGVGLLALAKPNVLRNQLAHEQVHEQTYGVGDVQLTVVVGIRRVVTMRTLLAQKEKAQRVHHIADIHQEVAVGVPAKKGDDIDQNLQVAPDEDHRGLDDRFDALICHGHDIHDWLTFLRHLAAVDETEFGLAGRSALSNSELESEENVLLVRRQEDRVVRQAEDPRSGDVALVYSAIPRCGIGIVDIEYFEIAVAAVVE